MGVPNATVVRGHMLTSMYSQEVTSTPRWSLRVWRIWKIWARKVSTWNLFPILQATFIPVGRVSPPCVTLFIVSYRNVRHRACHHRFGQPTVLTPFQTNSTLNSFFLAMARNTDIMRTAQRQLDGVLGGGRLPDHSDIDDLPYIVAIVKESLRWAPPAPMGTTRRLMKDDVYRGMFIPRGATMVENIWWGGSLVIHWLVN